MGTLKVTLGLLLCAGMMFLFAVVIVWFLRDLERRGQEYGASTSDGDGGFVGFTGDSGGRKSIDTDYASGDGGGFGEGGGAAGGGD